MGRLGRALSPSRFSGKTVLDTPPTVAMALLTIGLVADILRD